MIGSSNFDLLLSFNIIKGRPKPKFLGKMSYSEKNSKEVVRAPFFNICCLRERLCRYNNFGDIVNYKIYSIFCYETEEGIKSFFCE